MNNNKGDGFVFFASLMHYINPSSLKLFCKSCKRAMGRLEMKDGAIQ